MNDLISKSAIVDRLSEEAKRLEDLSIHSKGQAADYYTGRKNGFAKAAIIANNFPTIDAVPVVRCGNCKYFQWDMRQECRHWCGSCDPTDFCSYGERREK